MAAKTFEDILKSSQTTDEPTGESFSIFKTDDDKRLVFGWASVAVTVDGEQLEDRQKDIIEPEDLEAAAYEYVLNFRDTGEEHISSMRKKGKLVESVVFTEEKQQAMGIPPGTLPVAWWIGFKIEDDAAWARVKNGTYKMFSIEGKANRIPVEKSRKDYDEYPEYGMWLEENLDATIEEQKAAKEYYETHKEEARRNWKYAPPSVEKGRLKGCGVLVVQDGKILSGTRIERGGRGKICGPGGHIEAGETPEEAAKREAMEEFSITCEELTPLGTLKDGSSAIFLCTKFSGTPKTDEKEMTEPKWRTIEELEKVETFSPFEQSLEFLDLSPAKRHSVAKTFGEVLKFNPFHDSLGRFATANGYATFTTQTKDPKKQHWADKAIARMKQQAAANPPAPPTPPKPKKNFDSKGFADYDDADYHQLYNRKQYYQQQQLTPAQQKAADSYVDPNTEPGSLYNVAQNLNWAMVNGRTPTGKHKQVHDDMMDAMHNIGHNVTLTRYDHAGMIDSLLSGLGAGSDYTRMSISNIQKALVGQTLGENKFISTTVNNFSKAPSSAQNLFTNRAVKINYKAKANVQGLLMPIGSGGDQGEMVLAPTNGKANQAPKITAVRMTGKTVYRTYTGRNYPQIEIDLEWD